MIYGNFFKIKNQYGFLDRKIGTWMKMEKKNTWMIQYPEFQQFWSTGTAQYMAGPQLQCDHIGRRFPLMSSSRGSQLGNTLRRRGSRPVRGRS